MECAQTAVMENDRIQPSTHRDRTIKLHRSKFNSRESARACLIAVDECLNYLEERHLAGAYIARHSGCRKIVTALVRRLGITPPPSVEEARTSYALHCALLDWEGGILDSLIPNRHQRFPDLDLERDEWPVPRRRRRSRQTPGRQAQGRNALAPVA
jgi:hypothetical protein